MVLLDLQPKSGSACSLSWKASDQGFKPGTPSPFPAQLRGCASQLLNPSLPHHMEYPHVGLYEWLYLQMGPSNLDIVPRNRFFCGIFEALQVDGNTPWSPATCPGDPALPLPSSAAKAPLLQRIFCTSRSSSQRTSLDLDTGSDRFPQRKTMG